MRNYALVFWNLTIPSQQEFQISFKQQFRKLGFTSSFLNSCIYSCLDIIILPKRWQDPAQFRKFKLLKKKIGKIASLLMIQVLRTRDKLVQMKEGLFILNIRWLQSYSPESNHCQHRFYSALNNQLMSSLFLSECSMYLLFHLACLKTVL